jgi:hypothetical protein
MTTIKSIAFLLSASILSSVSFAQTATKQATPTTTTVKKAATTTVKAATTVKTTTATKAPQTTVKKAATKKTTTTAKASPKKTTTVAKTTTTIKTTTTPSISTSTTTNTKVLVPVVQKTETAVVPVLQTGTQIPAATQTTTTTTNTTTTITTKDGKTTTDTQTNTQQTNTKGGTTIDPNTVINTITDGDATSAIKEALMKGIQVGVDKVSITDGFFGNSLIKIPFPAQVKQVESTLRSVGMGSLIDNAVLSMNRAAESAAKQAGPIFINGIKQMTVTDAVNIVSNQNPTAATQFLQRTTTESLVASFKPSIKTALDKTLATKYWSDITGYYNKIPFVSPISTDLPDYVTRKAIDGLFIMVGQEEAKIRKDPAGTANDIIKTVFGKVKQ